MTTMIVKYRGGEAEALRRGIDPLRETGDTIGFMKSAGTTVHEWDRAHETRRGDTRIVFAEPDVDTTQPFYPPETLEAMKNRLVDEVDYGTYISDWSRPETPEVWHIKDDYSQLKAAREHVSSLENKTKVRIAHLDTGYAEGHRSFPEALVNLELARNFVDGEDKHDARDTFSDRLLEQPGHGAGTLSILAGQKMPVAGCTDFDDYVGLSDSIEIVPLRISKSVVLLKSAAFVKAMDYILELNRNENTRIHVVTMSMGGLPSSAWADMVNEAYEQGIFMVSAGGNNFAKLPTRRLIYPARFKRVVAACGVTHDFSPYAKKTGEGSFHIMEGNHGPLPLMDTAMAAFTPNVPWAIYKKKDLFGIRGDGTSSATPQIAAAAALYYAKHYKALEALEKPWMKVEAIRHALFLSARKHIHGTGLDYREYYGNGILRALDALRIEVPDAKILKKQGMDSVLFPFFRLVFGLRRELSEEEKHEMEMLETELSQIVLSDPDIQKLLEPVDDDVTDLTPAQRAELARLVIRNEKASDTLRRKMQETAQNF